MISIEATAFLRRVHRAIARAPERAFRGLRTGFRRYVRDFRRRFTRSHLSKPGSARKSVGDPRPGLFRRTGALARALTSEVRGNSVKTLVGRIGWTDDFAATVATVHEKGATITPKSRRYLTVPLPAAMTPAGVLRRPPRQWGDTFVRKGTRGGLFIFQQRGKRVVPLFILRRRVKVPPRLEFEKTFREDERNRIRILNRALTEALK